MVEINLAQPTIYLCVARRGSGKSEVMRYLYHHFKGYYNAVFVICPTEKTGLGFWKQQGVPDANIQTSYSDSWANKLMDKLEEKNKGRTKENGFRTLLIMDDCTNESTKFHNLTSIRRLAGRSRHFLLSTIVSAQTLTSVPPTLRINACALMVGRLNRQSLELLEKEFNVGMPKKDFIKMADNLPEYGFLVISNTASKSGQDVNANYGYFKASLEK